MFFVESSVTTHMCPICQATLRYRDSRQRIRRKEGGLKDQLIIRRFYCKNCRSYHNELPACLVPYKHYETVVLCQEKVQIKYNQFSLCLAKLNLLFLSHFLLDFSDILPHIGLGINTRNGCEYVLYCKMFLCIQKSTYMHVYN